MKVASLTVVPTNIPHAARRRKSLGNNMNINSTQINNDADRFIKK